MIGLVLASIGALLAGTGIVSFDNPIKSWLDKYWLYLLGAMIGIGALVIIFFAIKKGWIKW